MWLVHPVDTFRQSLIVSRAAKNTGSCPSVNASGEGFGRTSAAFHASSERRRFSPSGHDELLWATFGLEAASGRPTVLDMVAVPDAPKQRFRSPRGGEGRYAANSPTSVVNRERVAFVRLVSRDLPRTRSLRLPASEFAIDAIDGYTQVPLLCGEAWFEMTGTLRRL